MLPIEKILPNIAPKWNVQDYKKVRYGGYYFWLEAYDRVVRQENGSLCSAAMISSVRGDRYSSLRGVMVAWRTGSEAPFDWVQIAKYNVGDVVWANSLENRGLKAGDTVIKVRGILPPPKRKIKLAPNLALPKAETGNAEFDKIVAKIDPVDGGHVLYRDGKFSLIAEEKKHVPTSHFAPCRGQATVSSGGMGVSLSSMVKGVTGIGKALIDDDPNRYYRGNHSPVFRRFTADVFTEDQLKWMIVDQFAADQSVTTFDGVTETLFKTALQRTESETAARLGYPASTEAFGPDWRSRTAFLAVYVGLKMGLSEKDYASFLDTREKVMVGGVSPARAAVRADVLHKWFSKATQHPSLDRMTEADVRASAIALDQ